MPKASDRWIRVLPLLALVTAPACAPSADEAATGEASYTTVGECAVVETKVSKDTCTSNHQCGTSALPFCTIGQGIRTGGDVKVAASAAGYAEDLVLADGVVVEGGYEPTFAAAPAADAFTTVNGHAVIPAGVTTTLRRLAIERSLPATALSVLPDRQHAIVIDGSAKATLERVRVSVRPDPSAPSVFPLAETTAAIAVLAGGGGSLTLEDCDVHAAPGKDTSSALVARVSSTEMKIQRSTLHAGAALRSVAINVASAGTLEVGESTIATAEGEILTAGIRALGPADGDLTVRVSGSTITGAPVGGYPGNASIFSKRWHFGISARNASLELRSSDVVANPAADVFSTAATAVEVAGFKPVRLVAENNTRILGGHSESWNGVPPKSIGLAAIGDVTTTIRENQDVRGSSPSSQGGEAYGLFLHAFASGYDNVGESLWRDFQTTLEDTVSAAPTWTVEDNQLIAGGGGASARQHIGIWALSAQRRTPQDPDPAPASLVVRSSIVVGNPEAGAVDLAPLLGIRTDGVNATIEKNRIAIGPGANRSPSYDEVPSSGLRIKGPAGESLTTATVLDNEIDGSGVSGYGARLVGVKARFERNFVHDAGTGLGFQADKGSLYVNNVVEGMFSACSVGCSINDWTDRCGLASSDFTMANNLCYGSTMWALVMNERAATSRITGNIIDGPKPVVGSYANGYDHNAIVVRGSGCAYTQWGSWSCIEASPAGIGTENWALSPGYVGPVSAPWKAASFAPDAACAVRNRGETIAGVEHDFTGKPRQGKPDVGPFECP